MSLGYIVTFQSYENGLLFFNASQAICDLCIYNHEATEFEA